MMEKNCSKSDLNTENGTYYKIWHMWRINKITYNMFLVYHFLQIKKTWILWNGQIKIESETEKWKIIKKAYYNLNQIIKYEILYYGR